MTGKCQHSANGTRDSSDVTGSSWDRPVYPSVFFFFFFNTLHKCNIDFWASLSCFLFGFLSHFSLVPGTESFSL